VFVLSSSHVEDCTSSST